jgi:hypothetical protein
MSRRGAMTHLVASSDAVRFWHDDDTESIDDGLRVDEKIGGERAYLSLGTRHCDLNMTQSDPRSAWGYETKMEIVGSE